ncbi:MAG: DUF1385 domain-containing protein [Clostridia bacterium]|nr:DUF1385 domain-containing protein [Clostridia bacterium]
MSKKDKNTDPLLCRRNKVGGQAVLEGVMMKSGERVCLAVRKPDGQIQTEDSTFVSVRKKSKFLALPIIRGVVNFVESMIMSFKILSRSAEMLGVEEQESKFEKWLREKFGASIMAVVMPISVILGLALSVGLFIFLPTTATSLLERIFGALPSWAKGIIEGVLKLVIFIVYLLLVSLMPDIKRTFQYHGSEHKTIACYEKGLELTVENVRTQRRFHPRCGTSFMIVMILISIAVGMLIPWEWADVNVRILNILIRTGFKLLLVPLVCGIGYEFLMYAGKHDNFIIRALSAPGLWMQRITTKEPDDSMIEVAIAATKGALPDEFPKESELESDESTDEVKDNGHVPTQDAFDEANGERASQNDSGEGQSAAE